MTLKPGTSSSPSRKPGSPKSLSGVIALYLGRRERARWPVSVAAAVQAIRAVLPDCDLDDGELADLVVIASIERKLSVAFDFDLLKAS